VIDTVIKINFNSGNINQDSLVTKKIEIEKISFTTKIPVNGSFKIIDDNINFVSDIEITNVNKTWDFVESNSFNCKIILKDNLKDFLLKYIAFSAIYSGDLEYSLEIFRKLKIEDGNKSKSHRLSSGRVNSILINLFFQVSMEAYNRNNYSRCYELIKDALNIFGSNHHLSFKNYINLSNVAYRLGEIDDAILYTNSAKNISPNRCEILINEAFFMVVKKDTYEISKKFKRISKKYKKSLPQNISELVSFLCEERVKTNDKDIKLLISFAIAFYTHYYSDKKLGAKLMLEFVSKYKSSLLYDKRLEDIAQKSLLRNNKRRVFNKAS